jgi:hypothetical protein
MKKPARLRPRSRSMRTLAPLLLAALAATAAVAGAARADNPTLTGDVGAGDSFTITLKDASGAGVRHLDPGTYTLLVHDHSQVHDFHLAGPGVDVSTPVDQTGDFTFTVALVDGTYTFVCDEHATVMRGTFTVGAPAAAPPPAAAPTKLLALVGPGARVALQTADGSPPTGLAPGAFTIVVSDRSAVDGLRLAGPGISKTTGVGFKGTVSWKVTLAAGTYRYSAVRHPRLGGSFTVSKP